MSNNIDTDDIEFALNRDTLRFPRPLERAYLNHYIALRGPMVPIWGTVGTALYCMGAIGDQTMMASNADLLFWLRFGVFLPYGILVIVLMRFFANPRLYELLAIGVGVLGALMPMSVLAITKTDYAFAYQNGTISTLLFMVIVLRPRFYASLLGCAVIFAIQVTTTAMSGNFDDVSYAGIVTLYMTFVVFLLLAAFAMERAERRNFLQHLYGQKLTEKLQFQSEHDDLSGLKNRRALAMRLDEVWRDPECSQISAIMLDIDHFKTYNDTHGHMAGDRCIQRVSAVVLACTGRPDDVYRYGGEEILVLLPGKDRCHAARLAETIRLAILAEAIPHPTRGEPPYLITASMGVSGVNPQSQAALTLLTDADAALYQAKDAGRNRVYPTAKDSVAHSQGSQVQKLAQ